MKIDLEDLWLPAGVIEDGRFVEANRALDGLAGQSVACQPWREIFAETCHHAIAAALAAVLAGGTQQEPVRALARGGAVPVDLMMSACEREGRPAIALLVRELVRDRLATPDAAFRELVDASPIAVMVHGPAPEDFEIRYVNRAMAEVLGYEHPRELVGNSSLDLFVHPDDHATVLEVRTRRADGEDMPPSTVRWIHKCGAIREMRVFCGAVSFDGSPATLVYAQDITVQVALEGARAEAEAALRRSEERYRLLFDATPLPVWIIDPATLRFIAVNDAMARTHGYTRDELLAMSITELKVSGDLARLLEGVAVARPGLLRRIGARKHRCKDGRLITIDITVQVIELDGGPAILGIGVDVTRAQQLEEQLRQAQKMEAIGQLAGGIAHDFNNILGVITMNVELARDGVGAGHPAGEDLDEIATAATRAAALTRQLLAFSRKQPRDVTRVSLNSIVAGVEDMLTRLVGEDIRMTTNLAPQLAAIEADRNQLEQILINLVVNARDAMPAGGALVIETEDVVLDELEALGAAVAAGRYVKIEVRDTGCGMDAVTREHVFEPFFTTKGVGKGTGLGLATVFGIVKQSGGGIAIDSSPGGGATFRIYFPAVDGAATAWPRTARTTLPHGTETVLLVEDNVQLRSVLERQLGSWGYCVLAAGDGVEALAIAEQHAGALDLLLTDLVMPGMDGRSLGDRLLARYPHTKVVYMSGHTEHPALKSIELRPCDHFVQKPFTARELSETIRRALEPCDRQPRFGSAEPGCGPFSSLTIRM